MPVVAALLLAFALMLSSAVQKSSTVDEQTHLFRGAAYLVEGATHFRDVHPPMGFALNALPLLTEPALALPLDTPAWNDGLWEQAADAFLWHINADPLRIILLGRLPTIWLTLLLGALVHRWGRQAAGPAAATAALVLLLFDPNILAHGRLITNDIPLTLWLTLVFYSYWRWARGGRLLAVVGLGVALGLAASTKYSSVTIVPALGLLALWLAYQRRSWRPVTILFLSGLVALLILWGFYGFQLRPFPLEPVWSDLQWTLDYLGRPPTAYLYGRIQAGGWWYYFPVAFLLKTPLVTLGLIAWAVVVAVLHIARHKRPGGHDWTTFLSFSLMPVVYGVFTIFSPFNIGYRHLLPVLPFLVLFAATTLLAPSAATGRRSRRAAALLAGSLAILSVFIWPNYLPYFNLLAGGDGRNWRALSDSNIDWGQDLPALARWNARRQDGETLYFSYFGTAHPAAYGLEYNPLPTWAPAPEQAPPARQLFDPRDPAPGCYAISVTNLHGHVLGEHADLYAAFRDLSPVATIGGSIRIYHVEEHGSPFDIAFAGLTPAQLDEALRASMPGNGRRVRWLDDPEGLVWSLGGSWLATAFDMPEELLALLPERPMSSAGRQSLYWLAAFPDIPWIAHASTFHETMTFLGSQITENGPDGLTILTAWEMEQETDRPLKIFIHALDESGQLVAQWDGLSADPQSFRAGDRLIQRHNLPLPDSADVSIVAGVYDGQSLERLTLPDGRDHVVIK